MLLEFEFDFGYYSPSRHLVTEVGKWHIFKAVFVGNNLAFGEENIKDECVIGAHPLSDINVMVQNVSCYL